MQQTEQAIRQRTNADAAFNQLISQMRTTDDVRPFMCPKSNGNVRVCEKCDGFRTCTAGQRMLRLSTEENMTIQAEEIPDQKQDVTERDREDFTRALESGNAWNYLMQTRQMSRDAAGELLRKMVRKFPNLAAEYGGSRRIMQRPKVVTITTILPEKTDSKPQEEPPIAAPEQKPEAPEKKKRGAAGTAGLVRKTRELCSRALSSPDPIAFLMKESGSDAYSARERLRRWSKQYPDLFKGIELPSRRTCKRQHESKNLEKETVMEKQKGLQEPEEDEISLEEFLQNIPGEAQREHQIPRRNSDPMVESMRNRLTGLKAEKERLEAEIEAARIRMKKIDDQRAALELCISQFEEEQP